MRDLVVRLCVGRCFSFLCSAYQHYLLVPQDALVGLGGAGSVVGRGRMDVKANVSRLPKKLLLFLLYLNKIQLWIVSQTHIP